MSCARLGCAYGRVPYGRIGGAAAVKNLISLDLDNYQDSPRLVG